MKKATFFAGPTMLAFCILAVAQTAQRTAPKVKVGTQLTAKAATPRTGSKGKEYHSESQRGERRHIGQGFAAFFVLDGRIGRR
jgi:hypothetical protein